MRQYTKLHDKADNVKKTVTAQQFQQKHVTYRFTTEQNKLIIPVTSHQS